jgi:hypothetical protein
MEVVTLIIMERIIIYVKHIHIVFGYLISNIYIHRTKFSIWR